MLGPGGALEPDSRTSWHPIRIQPAAANRNHTLSELIQKFKRLDSTALREERRRPINQWGEAGEVV
jgi:hypothetical protein